MATPRDLLMQVHTVADIAQRMQVNELELNSKKLPLDFAREFSTILEKQAIPECRGHKRQGVCP